MPALASLNDIYRVQTTPKKLIKRALRLIGVLPAWQEVEALELQDGVEALNAMLDSWNTEKLMVYVLARNQFTLTAATNPHQIGPGLAAPDFDAPRPNRIEQGQAYLSGGQLGTASRELEVWTRGQWEAQYDSALSGVPCAIYYEPSFQQGKIWTDVKADAGYTLTLHLEQLLQQTLIGDVNTECNFPPGYTDAVTYGLAVELAPEYSRAAPAEVLARFVEAKANVKRLNIKPLHLTVDPALTSADYYMPDITRGDF